MKPGVNEACRGGITFPAVPEIDREQNKYLTMDLLSNLNHPKTNIKNLGFV
jgi:hypothetical protein